jgi:serine protease inhibitor
MQRFILSLPTYMPDLNTVVNAYDICVILHMLSRATAGNSKAELENYLHSFDYKYIEHFSEIEKLVPIYNSFFIEKLYWPRIADSYIKSFESIGTIEHYDKHMNHSIQINKFYKRISNGLLDSVVEPQLSDTSYLVSVSFYKCIWKTQFDNYYTKIRVFYPIDSTSKRINMMQQIGIYNYYEDANCQHIEIPLTSANDRLVFGIYLPSVFRKIIYNYPANFQRMVKKKLSICFPKFRHISNINLDQIFTNKLGIRTIFDQQSGNFDSALFAGKMKGFAIGKIKHECVVVVDETGGESQDVPLKLSQKQVNNPEEENQKFIADHTFIYYIRDIETGLIIIQGVFN